MRIAYLSTFYPYRGGIAQFNASLYRALEKENEIKAFTFSRQYPDTLFPGKTQYVSGDETADNIPSNRILDSINPFSYLSASHIIRKFNPDILLMKYWMSFFAPSLGSVSGKVKKNAKVITILDNVIPHEQKFFDKPLTKYFLKKNSGFVVMSDAVKEDLLQLKPDAAYIKMPHPLYNHFGQKLDKQQARKLLHIHPDKKTILFFGFIRDYKGLDLLIEAFGKLDTGYQLVIAGESYGSFDAYQKLIDASPRKDSIHCFNDYIPDSKVPEFFSAADVCVLPYKSATQSGITSISYHFDVPLIATNVGGLQETIEHRKTGLIVELANADMIKDAILHFYSESSGIDYFENIQSYKRQLSWENFASGIIDFAKSL